MDDISGGRVRFSQIPPPGESLYWRGGLYDAPGGQATAAEAERIARDPELLNGREADLALIRRDPETGVWRLLRGFGAAPLYYAPLSDGFAWSFAYRGLLDLLGGTEPDEATLFDYLATHYRYVFRDPGRTFHRGVRQAPVGSYVDIGPQGVKERAWLDLERDPEVFRLGPEEASGRLMSLLRRAVGLRAAAARRPAFTISSGLDGSTVASLAAERLGPLNVFSVGYGGPDVTEYDETEGLKDLLEAHPDWRWRHLVVSRPALAEETEKLIRLTRSPVITATWLAYHLMAREFEDFEEVFTGLGGDESLAGEFGHFFYFFAELKAAGEEVRLAEEMEAWSRLHDHPVFRKNPAEVQKFWERNVDFATGEIKLDLKTYMGASRFFDDSWFETHDARPRPPLPRPYPNFLSNRLFQELRFETTPPTLWGLFMCHEAAGPRAVSPFMSQAVFRHCLSLPGAVKYERGLTKALLRRGLKGLLPEKTRLRSRKTGFNAPIDLWFNEPKTARLTMEMIMDGPMARLGWLKKGAAELLFREHRSGRANHMMILWPLLNVSLFLMNEKGR